MNFDNIKEAWDNQSANDFEVPQKIKKLKSAQQPIDKIKKNMQHELYAQFFGILIIGIFPQIFNIIHEFYLLYYAFYALMILVSAYYFIRFYFFFKEINHSTLNSKENLYELYYEIRLKIEMYKSFAYLLAPFSILLSSILIFGLDKKGILNKLATITNTNMVLFFIFFSAIIILVAVLTNWWVNYFYGKYAKQIRNVLDEFKE